MENYGEILGALATLAIALAGYFELRTRQIKKSVDQINNAVNNVQPGQLSLTKRVDRIDETLISVQYDQNLLKKEITELSDNIESSIQSTTNISEELLKSHVQTRERLEEVLLKLPKRKDD